VTFLTGHEDPTKDTAQIDWDRMASDVGTLVIFMGVKNLPHVVQELKRRGRPGDTPVALIRYGTLPCQETVVGVLDDIVEKVAAAKLRPPAITVIGEVVNLREKLHWFEDRPLFGLTIAVTRPRAQAAGQIRALRDLGAEVIAFPTIRIEQVTDSPEIDSMLAGLESYDLIIFTSVNGVEGFFDRLCEAGGDARRLHRASVVAIGPKTAAACRRRGVVPDLLPDTFIAEGVLAVLQESGHLAEPGRRVLIPRARMGRELLPDALAAAGAHVDAVALYDTVLEEPDPTLLEDVLAADLVTFTSSSSAENFAALLRSAGHEARLREVRAASIGPATTETVLAEGMQLVLEAEEYTVEGLVEAIATQASPAVAGL
jgi:uroporphyrinogen III methyltransferase/synthase